MGVGHNAVDTNCKYSVVHEYSLEINESPYFGMLKSHCVIDVPYHLEIVSRSPIHSPTLLGYVLPWYSLKKKPHHVPSNWTLHNAGVRVAKICIPMEALTSTPVPKAQEP